MTASSSVPVAEEEPSEDNEPVNSEATATGRIWSLPDCVQAANFIAKSVSSVGTVILNKYRQPSANCPLATAVVFRASMDVTSNSPGSSSEAPPVTWPLILPEVVAVSVSSLSQVSFQTMTY